MNEYVTAGVALLDEKMPGWRSQIDWITLDIWSTDHCIIGQLRKANPQTCIFDALGLDGFAGSGIYGFDELRKDDEFISCDEMTEAWTEWALSEGLHLA